MLTCGGGQYMSPCSGTLSSNTTVRAGRRPPFDIPERRSHRRDHRRIKEVQFKRDYTRALHGLAGGPCICQSIWREDGRSFCGWYAPVLVGKRENSGGTPANQLCFLLSSGYFKASKRFFPARTFHLRDVEYVVGRNRTLANFGFYGQSRQPPRRTKTAIGTKNGRSPRSYSRLEHSRRDKKSSPRYL